ncbi:MAG: transcriptional regulator NrdR [Fimbriimonadaceae bacterium]
MKCPYCQSEDLRVLESRAAREGGAIRRRRECAACNRRFTTFEEPEKPRLQVIKRGGLREEFDRGKVLAGIRHACHKRPVPAEAMEEAAEQIEQEMYDLLEPEVSTTQIGDRVMEELLQLDAVAFVRFASVYREFDSPQEFAKVVSAIRRTKRDVRNPGVAASIVKQLVD